MTGRRVRVLRAVVTAVAGGFCGWGISEALDHGRLDVVFVAVGLWMLVMLLPLIETWEDKR